MVNLEFYWQQNYLSKIKEKFLISPWMKTERICLIARDTKESYSS